MRKLFLMLIVMITSLTSLTSCYNTKMICGNLDEKAPMVNIHSEWNHHLIYGLVPIKNSKIKVEDFVQGRKNYVIKNNMSFVNGLVSVLTFGIWTPTTTTFYLPYENK